MFNPKNIITTLVKPFKESYDKTIFWLPFAMFFILEFFRQGDLWVDISYLKAKFFPPGVDYDHEFESHSHFLNVYYSIYTVWSFVCLVVMVPIMSKVSLENNLITYIFVLTQTIV